MQRRVLFKYDDFSDRLHISCKNKEDMYYGSVRVLNLTIDFTRENKIMGIELRNASKYLESLSINPEILTSLTSAELVFQQQRDGYIIYFILHAKDKVERVPYNIIMQEPTLLH